MRSRIWSVARTARPDLDGSRGDGLVHDGKRVAHGAVAGFGEQGECVVFGGDLFVIGDLRELGENVVELDGVKAEVLAAGADGLGNVLGLGGGHHEDGVGGRLFEGLEQGVECGIGDLVGFVEDVDFVAIARAGRSGLRRGFADLVDAAVGGGVDLDDVDGDCPRRGFRRRSRMCRRAQGWGGHRLPISVRQFEALARMRAMVVLPMPRWPEKM